MGALGMGCSHRVQVQHGLGMLLVPVDDDGIGDGLPERQLEHLLEVDHRHDGDMLADTVFSFTVFEPAIKLVVVNLDAEVLAFSEVFEKALVGLHEEDFHLGSKPVFGVSGMLQVFIEPTFLLRDLWFDQIILDDHGSSGFSRHHLHFAVD